MAGSKLIDKLARSAAEKRAYGFMYGGGMPYGGNYGGMMNPYLGGMGYGGRWGGGGFDGGYPMMAQSYATPWGRGGYYGMDPMGRNIYGLSAMQGLDQSRQMFEHAALPGAGIGLQGQQLGVDQQRQLDPALQHGRQLEGAVTSASLAPQVLADPSQSSLVADIQRKEELMKRTQEEYDKAVAAGRGIGQQYQPKIQALQSRLGKVGQGTYARNVMMDAMVNQDQRAIDAAYELGWLKEPAKIEGETPEAYAQRRTEAAQAYGKKHTSGFGRGWREYTPFSPKGTEDYQDALAALGERKSIQGQWDEEKTRHEQALAAANQAREDAIKQHGMLQARQIQAQQDYEATRRAREEQAQGHVGNVAGRVAPTMGASEQRSLEAPQKPGQLPGATPPGKAPATTSTPPPRKPAPTPTFTPPAARPTAVVPPIGGGSGPRGPHGAIKVASLVQLADMAARIHREHQVKKASGIGDILGGQSYNVPGSQTRTGQGKPILGSDALKAKMMTSQAKPVMPAVAGAAAPRVSPADAMKAIGLSHLPSSMAHLPVESAVSMGMTADQHAKLRKLLGLG